MVHTSDWEGLARVLPQGLIAGKPVISFDTDGSPEVCVDNVTGLSVPHRDVRRLAAAMIRLAEDEPLRLRLGQTGRERFASEFRHEFMTGRIREVYERVLMSRDMLTQRD